MAKNYSNNKAQNVSVAVAISFMVFIISCHTISVSAFFPGQYEQVRLKDGQVISVRGETIDKVPLRGRPKPTFSCARGKVCQALLYSSEPIDLSVAQNGVIVPKGTAFLTVNVPLQQKIWVEFDMSNPCPVLLNLSGSLWNPFERKSPAVSTLPCYRVSNRDPGDFNPSTDCICTPQTFKLEPHYVTPETNVVIYRVLVEPELVMTGTKLYTRRLSSKNPIEEIGTLVSLSMMPESLGLILPRHFKLTDIFWGCVFGALAMAIYNAKNSKMVSMNLRREPLSLPLFAIVVIFSFFSVESLFASQFHRTWPVRGGSLTLPEVVSSSSGLEFLKSAPFLLVLCSIILSVMVILKLLAEFCDKRHSEDRLRFL